ncbi:hypothetical protein [Tuwongella immobilis]|uniref:Uncharacterized protein n=1 Tax=Tuwongella immobilis TaxID=692036 RepID=A0A6C2YJT8_9BACT|nr:hypothetical protein [Tuwongella immobilis]VIP01489.1 unnamed protein product [Tuwongella immobilis]VTR98559.1 unnamed protein product [Tuwongella immobilis]
MEWGSMTGPTGDPRPSSWEVLDRIRATLEATIATLQRQEDHWLQASLSDAGENVAGAKAVQFTQTLDRLGERFADWQERVDSVIRQSRLTDLALAESAVALRRWHEQFLGIRDRLHQGPTWDDATEPGAGGGPAPGEAAA